MEKRWVIKPSPARETVIKLIEDLSVSRPLATILAQRGIDNFDEAKKFFTPEIE